MRSIEFRMILSMILFTILVIALERYQVSQNITQEFVNFKKSKNKLLVDTITPVIALNISLGLHEANKEYLSEILKQNSDLEYVRLLDSSQNTLYDYHSLDAQKKVYEEYNDCAREIKDEFSNESIAHLELRFSNKEYENMQRSNEKTTRNISVVTFVLLLAFVLFMKHMFKNLKELQEIVLAYDPKRNNFPLELSKKKDEVSLIRNAIISMVKKIAIYTEALDNANTLLEEKVRQRTLELEASNAELKLLASVDPLTSLYNRRYFTKSSQQIFELIKRNGSPLAVLMFDIDNFKSVNDTYGHQIGDDVIVSIAKTLKEMTRQSDLSCRFGGEEFVALFPETGLDGAYAIAEKIRLKIESTEIKLQDNKTLFCTVSMGIATFDKSKDQNIEEIIHRADSAMYEAKEGGKNTIRVRG